MNTAFDTLKSGSNIIKLEPIRERKKRLRKLESWMLSNLDRIRAAVYKDMRKSVEEVDRSEVFPILTELREARRNLKSWTQPKPIETALTFLGTRSYVRYEPKGVCLIISPWNYPLSLALGPVTSAIAAGNTFILKPSEFTPTVSSLLKDMIEETLPENIGQVHLGDVKVAQDLLKLPFDHLFFTGSPAVGKLIMKAASEHLSSITLELGGKSPTIVDETASVKDAAKKIAWGKWLNAGQTCLAPDYLLVHETIYDQFLSALLSEATKRFNEQSYTGIVHEKHLARFKKMIKDAEKKGAKVSLKGDVREKECVMNPTILTEVNDQMDVMKEEIFGPVLPVLKYQSMEEALRLINSFPKALSSYLFTRNKKNQKRFLQETSSGSVVINDNVLHFAHPYLPFGGVNNSGIGRSHGYAGFLAFSNDRSVVHQRVGFTLAQLFYPPYTKWKNQLILLLIKYF